MKVFTIGFTKKNAEQFFARLKQPGLQRVVDTRLNNISQLAGFTKKDDLRFFKLPYINTSDRAGVSSAHNPGSCARWLGDLEQQLMGE